jgi:hypothetical protein
VLCHGTPKEVLSHPVAREHYFGTGIEMDGPRPARAIVPPILPAAQPVPSAAVPLPKGLARARSAAVHEEETLTE